MDTFELVGLLTDELADLVTAIDSADRTPFGDMGKLLDEIAECALRAGRYADQIGEKQKVGG